MTKNEYNQLFDDASDEFSKLCNTPDYQEKLASRLDLFRKENGALDPTSLTAFVINESTLQAKQYLHILLQKFFDIDE